MLRKLSLGLVLLAILIFNAYRFWKLDTVPGGYHVDEVSAGVTMECLAHQGCDAELIPHPLFAFMEYGQDRPPTYIYPGVLWVKLFGSTVPSLRAYSVFVFELGLLGLFFLGRGLFGKIFGIVAVLAATCSPWSWVVTRVAFESYFAPVFTIWGLYFFWRSSRWRDWAIAGFLFVCAMYSYPPARMQVPMMLVVLWGYEWGRRPLRWPSVLSFGSAFVLLLPMVPQYLSGQLARRFNLISIFNSDYLHSLGKTGSPGDIISVFVHNYLLHLSPNFLFFTGDPSYVHSTRHLGIFSWLDMGALLIFMVFLVLAFVRRGWQGNPVIRHHRWLVFLAVNFFIGIIPSALTNQELPHALRISGSWMFMMLFTGFMWWSAAQCAAALWPLLALAGILCGGVLVYQYFTVYPLESRGMFDYWIKEAAEELRTQDDWQKFLIVYHRQNYDCMYFLVHRLGMNCKQAHDVWWQLMRQLQQQGQF